MELSSYSWEIDKDGQFTGKPEKEHDHLMDAMRYGTDPILRSGKGRVAIARGIDAPKGKYVATIDPATPSQYKCRRVFVTHE